MNFRHFVSSASAAAVLGLASMASAQATPIAVGQSVVYNLNVIDTNGHTSATPYATVTLTQLAGEVDFTVTPGSGFAFANTGGKHDVFAFNLLSAFDNATVSLTGTNQADFQILSGAPFNETPFGNFGHAIDFVDTIGNGLSASYTKSLTFSVAKANLVVDDFIKNADGYFFASDMGTLSNGRTLTVAAVVAQAGGGGGGSNGGQVPEPASLTLVGTGLLLAALRRRKS